MRVGTQMACRYRRKCHDSAADHIDEIVGADGWRRHDQGEIKRDAGPAHITHRMQRPDKDERGGGVKARKTDQAFELVESGRTYSAGAQRFHRCLRRIEVGRHAGHFRHIDMNERSKRRCKHRDEDGDQKGNGDRDRHTLDTLKFLGKEHDHRHQRKLWQHGEIGEFDSPREPRPVGKEI